MAIEDDIEIFHQWAQNLGCPENSIPNNEALKSIFKSRQHDIFRNLVKRVKPLQIVQEAHNNITLSQAEPLKNQVIPHCERPFLCKRIQTYLKWKDLQKKLAEDSALFEKYKTEYEEIAASIKAMNVQNISLIHKKKTLQGLTSVLSFKAEQLDKQLLRDIESKQQILSSIPVKINARKDFEQESKKLVEQALQELQIFYVKTNETSSCNGEPITMQELWQKMRNILGNVPSYVMFHILMKLKDEQRLHIIGLNEKHHQHVEDKVTSGHTEISAFEVKLLKTKAEVLCVAARYLQARTKRQDIEQRFCTTYTQFVDDLRQMILALNMGKESDDMDEQISDFLVQFNLRNMKRSQNEFLNQQMDQLKGEISDAAKHLEHHELILDEVKQMYIKINSCINRVQYEISQLGQIRDKLLYARNVLKHTVNEKAQAVGVKQNVINGNAMRLKDVTLGSGDSFELGGDSVFCSTKLDFDATLMLNNTQCGTSDISQLPASGGRFILAPHVLELNTFFERPMQHYSAISDLCAFYIAPSPLITECRELNSLIQLVPGLLLPPHYALVEVRDRIKLSQAIDDVSQKLHLDVQCMAVDLPVLRERRKAQHEQMAESLDKIERNVGSLKHLLERTEKLYDFVLDNPMGRFIPSSKRYKNYTFKEYETEFLRYQRMVGNCI